MYTELEKDLSQCKNVVEKSYQHWSFNVTSSKSLTSCDEDDDDSVGTIQLGSSNKLSIIDSIDNFAKRKRKLFSSVDIFENVDKRSTHVIFVFILFLWFELFCVFVIWNFVLFENFQNWPRF